MLDLKLEDRVGDLVTETVQPREAVMATNGIENTIDRLSSLKYLQNTLSMTSFSLLLLDILPAIFQELDIADFAYLGMASHLLFSRSQYSLTLFPSNETDMQRPLWGRVMPPSPGGSTQKVASGGLDSQARHTPARPPLSTEDIKTFVIGRMKLRRRFNDCNKNLGFAVESTAEIHRICDLMLLPGGRSLLSHHQRR